MNNQFKGIGPENVGYFCLKKKSTTHIKKMLMLPLNNPVLLRSCNIRSFMKNTLTIIKIIKKKLFAIIGTYFLKLARKLIFYQNNKVLKKRSDFCFIFKKKNPSKYAIIINYSQKILVSINGRDRNRATNINMDKFKKLKRFTCAGRIFQTFLFRKSTNITSNNRRRKNIRMIRNKKL